jgi:hypothetical protein
MVAAVSLALMFFPQANGGEPVKTTVCEVFKQPEVYNGKLVQVRAIVESGVDDLPAGIADESCGADLKFFMPEDPDFGRLLKSNSFRKLIKAVKKNPVVEATVIGRFRRAAADPKSDAGLALVSVDHISTRPQPRVGAQKR